MFKMMSLPRLLRPFPQSSTLYAGGPVEISDEADCQAYCRVQSRGTAKQVTRDINIPMSHGQHARR